MKNINEINRPVTQLNKRKRRPRLTDSEMNKEPLHRWLEIQNNIRECLPIFLEENLEEMGKFLHFSKPPNLNEERGKAHKLTHAK